MADCNCKNGTNGIATACPECDIPQMARNNYFTGKLLVERDFTDEQRYTMGKLRRHNQRLHGWGAVCGLKVEQHPNPACQSQYVLVEPGTGIDCCGREILVPCAEYFDFAAKFLANWQQQYGPSSQPDTVTPHTLQICISYKECNTENVPALFDDCSAGAASCHPNRILESRDFDVLIDPEPSPVDPYGVEVKWAETIGINDVARVVENDTSGTLYALASSGSPANATLYAVDSDNGSITAAASFPNNAGLDVQVSPAGDYVFVALQPTAAAPQILVLAAANLTTPFNTLPITGSANGDAIRLAVAPDGRLLAVVPSAGIVLVWNTDIESTTGYAAPQPVTVGTTPVDIAIGDGLYAYVANSRSSSVTAITLSSLAPTPITAGLGSAAPAAVAVATTTAGDSLAVLDATARTLYLIGIPSAGPGSAAALGTPVTPFAYKPIDVQISPGGKWVYVLEQDTSTPPNGYLQVVDVHAVAAPQPNVLGNPVSIAVSPENSALSGDGTHIYVPYQGDTAGTVPGAIAVIDVTQNGCADLIKCALEACPDCSEGNCIVLATIKNYTYQSAVIDSAIDNWTDRHILASTELLTRVMRCILERGGATGPQGPAGPAGPAGPGLETGLVQISALSWTHGAPPLLLSSLPQIAVSIPLTAASPGPEILGPSGSIYTTIYQGVFDPPLGVLPSTDSAVTDWTVTIEGFSNGGNNGNFNVVSCTTSQLTVQNKNGVVEAPTGALPTVTLPATAAIVIAFGPFTTSTVQMPTSHNARHIFQVVMDPFWSANLEGTGWPTDSGLGFAVPCPVAGRVIAVDATPNGGNLVTAARQMLPAPLAPTPIQALAFVFDYGSLPYQELLSISSGDSPVRTAQVTIDLLVRVRGDFLLDSNNRAISAEFVRHELPTGERPSGSGFCLEGGTFESWLTIYGMVPFNRT